MDTGFLTRSLPAGRDQPPTPAHPRPPTRRARVGGAVADAPDLLRKPVNTLAIVPKSARITTLGRLWSPWRSVATWYLWRSLDPVPVEY